MDTENKRMPKEETRRRHMASYVQDSLKHLDALIEVASHARRIYGDAKNVEHAIPSHFIIAMRGHVEGLVYADAAASALSMAGWFYPADETPIARGLEEENEVSPLDTTTDVRRVSNSGMLEVLKLLVNDFEGDFMYDGKLVDEPGWSPLIPIYRQARAALAQQTTD